MPIRRHPGRWTWLLLAFGCLIPAGLDGQGTARVRIDENFRAAPNGELLGRLDPGTPLAVVERREDWLQVELEGWVWTRSMQMRDQGSYDLVVAEDEGENIRAEPSGAILGRLQEGTLLEELERQPGWIRVRRRGWIWRPSVVETVAPPSEEAAAPAPAPASEETPPARRPGGFVRSGSAGSPILTAPDGDTLARTLPGTELEVTARQGSWARVRVEGWVWMPEPEAEAGEGAGARPGEEGGVLTPQALTTEPDAYRGRVVSWALQYISLERAESVRTDFFEGEPFLLCRYGGPEGPFVYVAVPPERLSGVEGLMPLERIDVTARVRTGASALTGTPIVDLLGLERRRDGR